MQTPIPLLLLFLALLPLCSPQSCLASQYFNGQRCAPCQTNCICSSEYGCDACMSGYTYDSKFKNCLPCPTATSAVNVGCAQCCSQIVATAFVCSSCPALSSTYLLGGQCVRIQGCISVSADGLCLACSTGYFLSNGKCTACHSSCTTCIDSTFCTACTTGYYNASNANYAVCAACPNGCSACSSSTVCTGCLSGFRLSGSNCVACGANCVACTAAGCTGCATGFVVSGVACVACPAGCLACANSGGSVVCSSCASNYYLSNTGACFSCSSRFPNSILCTSATPLQCLNDYSPTLTSRYHLLSGQCIANTKKCKTMSTVQGLCSECYFQPGAYYKLSNGVCVQCVQTGCASFGGDCTCLACVSGYQFVNRQCVACQNLNCYVCQSNVRSCQVCAPYYGLISSACIQCTQPTCLNCDGDSTKCQKCLTGYYPSSGTCFRCQSSCQSCTSSTLCVTCNAGFYLLSSGRCKSLPSNCNTVDSSGSCVKCDYGYQISSGMCVPCSVDLSNMGECSRFCPNYYATLTREEYLGFVLLSLLALAMLLS